MHAAHILPSTPAGLSALVGALFTYDLAHKMRLFNTDLIIRSAFGQSNLISLRQMPTLPL